MRCFSCNTCKHGRVLFDQIYPDDYEAYWAWICQECGKLHSPAYRSSSLETCETEVADPTLELLNMADSKYVPDYGARQHQPCAAAHIVDSKP